MTLEIRIRRARACDAALMSSLAQRSKAHWGYSREFMEAARAELTVSAQAIEATGVDYWVGLDEQCIAGFYALGELADGEVELEAMFVDPPYIGLGVGRQLMTAAKSQARQLGARSMLIQSDPNAVPFYQAAGARQFGELESFSIPGRMLPLLRLELQPDSTRQGSRAGAPPGVSK